MFEEVITLQGATVENVLPVSTTTCVSTLLYRGAYRMSCWLLTSRQSEQPCF